MLRISLEHVIADDGSKRLFAHMESDRVFGNAMMIKAGIPKGAWVSVPPNLQPAIDWYLVKHCGFRRIGEVDLEDGENVILEKVD